VAAFGAIYLSLATPPGPARASYAFAVTMLALAVTALAAAATAWRATHVGAAVRSHVPTEAIAGRG
jgi:hypothetical protein